MRDLNECKAIIRCRITEKEKKRSAIRKRMTASFVAVAAAFAVLMGAFAFQGKAAKGKNGLYSGQWYGELSEVVSACDLIVMGTLQGVRTVQNDSTKNPRLEYSLMVERCISGDYSGDVIAFFADAPTSETGRAEIDYAGYAIGESYIVFLRMRKGLPTVIASDVKEYEELSYLQGKIHVSNGKTEIDGTAWEKLGELSSTDGIDKLIELIQVLHSN